MKSLVEVLGHQKLSTASARMLTRFFIGVVEKFLAAEEKHGWKDEWTRIGEQREKFIAELQRHVQKGDPRDVAIYCAIAQHYGWSTNYVDERVERARCFLSQSAPHHRSRQWYQIIESFVGKGT